VSCRFDKAVLKISIHLSRNNGAKELSILLVILVTNTSVFAVKSFDFILELKSRAENVHEDDADSCLKEGACYCIPKVVFCNAQHVTNKKMNQKVEGVQGFP